MRMRSASLLLAASAALLAVPGTASADDLVRGGCHFQVSSGTNPNQVRYTVAAYATSNGVATGIQCWVTHPDGDIEIISAMPGPAAAGATTAERRAAGPSSVCYRVSAFYRDGTFYFSPITCTTP